MAEFSVLIGGKAGDGINQAGLLLAHLVSHLGYRVYMYLDYPSLIRGGHNFAIIRASDKKIAAHRDALDFVLALDQNTVNVHKGKLKDPSHIIYDSDSAKSEGIGHALKKIIKEENAAEIMRNSAIIGSFARSMGIQWETLNTVFRKFIPKQVDLNLKLARRAYDESREIMKVEPLPQKFLPVVGGNEAAGFGLIKAGLNNYVAYPMTPTSSLLHFLAAMQSEFDMKVIHPENEIAVILMALGFAYVGQKAAVGTSGGGFCLMTEALSLAGMAELPVVIVLGQRPGPSTGLPTYSSQTELHFALNAGQGEFPRFLVAPGDAEEYYYWSQVALNMAWKYQMPSIILTDKLSGEGAYSFDIDSVPEVKEEQPVMWGRAGEYKRYALTQNGVSPLAFAPDKDAIIKVNSYEHDEAGITTEDALMSKAMCDKRLGKECHLAQELEGYETVRVYGRRDAETAILCWGSNKGVCTEFAESQGLRVIQPVVLSPFPVNRFRQALQGVKKLVAVESNATGQLIRLLKIYGFQVDDKILKYDGRPFTLEDMEREWNAVAARIQF